MGFDGEFADKERVSSFGNALRTTAKDVGSEVTSVAVLRFDVPGVRTSGASAAFAKNVGDFLERTADQVQSTGDGVLKAGRAWTGLDTTVAREYTHHREDVYGDIYG